MVLELRERPDLGLHGMPPVDDDMARRMGIADAFSHEYFWLWGDSLWTLASNFRLSLHRLPQSEYNDAYRRVGPVWISHLDASRTVAQYEFARVLDQDFLTMCDRIGYEPEFVEPKRPMKPIYRRLQNYKWHLVHDNKPYRATLFEHFENSSHMTPDLNIVELPINAAERETSVLRNRLDRKTREHYYTMFAYGQLDELRMIAAL